MNLQNYYYYFQSALTPRFCDELIKYGKSQQEQIALTGGQTNKVNQGKPLDEKDILDYGNYFAFGYGKYQTAIYKNKK